MGAIPPSTIQVIAQSLQLSNVSVEAAKALAPDVEYRLREVVQEAQKFARHAKRSAVTTEDVNNVLRLKNVMPLLGFGGKDPARFVRAAGFQDLFYLQDPELSFEQVIDRPLPKCPVEVGVLAHWLAIEGVQPAIPENAPLHPRKPKRQRTAPSGPASAAQAAPVQAKAQHHGAGAQVAGTPPSSLSSEAAAAVAASNDQKEALVKQPVKHVLSQELQLYFDRVARMLRGGDEEDYLQQQKLAAAAGADPTADGAPPNAELLQRQWQRVMLTSLAEDPGLHPAVPYFSQLITEEVKANLRDLPRLHLLLKALQSLLANPHVQMEPYLHQLMPAVLTCLVGKKLGSGPVPNHWPLREEAARLAAAVCSKYGQPFYQIQSRIVKALNTAWQQLSNPLTTHYGAVVGLVALGHQTVRQVLLPNLAAYLTVLEPQMQQGDHELTRFEAYKVHGALLQASGMAMHDRIRHLQGAEPLHKPEGQQANVEETEASADTQDDMGPAPMQLAAPLVKASVQQQQQHSPGIMSVRSSSGGLPVQRAPQGTGRVLNGQGLQQVLSQAWDPMSDVGPQVAALHQLFGDALLPLIPGLP